MSTVPPGRHPNWCRCQGCRRDIARFESRQFKGTVIAALAVIAIGGVLAGATWAAHGIGRTWHAAWPAYVTLGGIAAAVLLILAGRGIIAADRAAAREAAIADALEIADGVAPDA